jgi:hypothetical protein
VSGDEMGKCDGCSNPATIEDWYTDQCGRWCGSCLASVRAVRAKPGRDARHRGAFMALGMVGLAVAWAQTMLRVADLRWVYEGEGSYSAAREVDEFLSEMGVSAAPGIRR